MNFLLTGASGYVGARVAQALISGGHHVTAVVRSANERVPSGILTVVGDLARAAELAALASEYEGLGHFAAAETPEFAAINARFMEALLKRLGPTQALAMHGGSLVFGDSGSGERDEALPMSAPPFLADRSALERSVLQAGHAGPRTFIVYGSMVHGGRGAMIPRALVEGARGLGRVVFPGDGKQTWSTVHVDDWAALIAALLERGPSGGQAYFAAGAPVTIKSLAEVCAASLGLPSPTPGTVKEVTAAYGFFAPALAMSQWFSAEKAHRHMGWIARKSDLLSSFREINA